jgi:hypothetical protein
MSASVSSKSQRKPRTKKIDMLKKKEDEEPKVPKKRGRKPKGGKIIKNKTPNIEPMIENKTIIMHLKCKLSDLVKKETNSINTIEHYDPNVVMNVEPYHEENNFATIQSIDSKHVKTDVNEKSQDVNYEIIDDKPRNDSNGANRDNMKKVINLKLKELEKNLNIKNINNNSACFWCTYEFNFNPIYIPSLYFQEKYDVYGCFCSPECACSHLFQENIDNNTKFERYQLLNYLYGKIYNYTKNIKPAPSPYYTLSKYYGTLSIQEYRQLLEYDRLILVIDKPLTKMYPELHEDNNDFETIYDTKISLKRTNKVDKNKVLSSVFDT